MLKSTVVEDHVHYHFQPLGVCLIYQTAILIVSAKSWVHTIVVGCGIAMIGIVVHAHRRVVLEHWCEPQCRHTQLGEVVQVLTDALQVATVAHAGMRAVAPVAAHALDHIVARVAIGKAVGHEHVEHIGVGEAVTLRSLLLAGFECILHCLLLLALLELELHYTGLGTACAQIDQQIVRRVESHQTVDTDTCIVGSYLGITDALAIDHQLHRRHGIVKPNIPVGGLNAVDLDRRLHGGRRGHQHE